MRFELKVLGLVAGLFLMPLLLTSDTLANETEIQHLLRYVENTDCVYERNGSQHTGPEAVKHINQKYKYFADDIDTTETFIQLAATQSSMSGRVYRVHCAGKPTIESAVWLKKELDRYRKSHVSK